MCALKIRYIVRISLILLIFINFCQSGSEYGAFAEDVAEVHSSNGIQYIDDPQDDLPMSGRIALEHSVVPLLSATPNNTAKFDSPITLDASWPKIDRLLLLVILSTAGILANSFYMSTFFVVNSLRKAGFIFMGCQGLSDMVIVTTVMATSAVVLLSGEWDSPPVCWGMYAAAVTSCYSQSIFIFLAALESHIRIFCTTNQYEYFKSLRIDVISCFVFIISIVLAGFGVYAGLDVDYCEQRHTGSKEFRIVTGVLFHGIPLTLAVVCYVKCAIAINRKARDQLTYRRSEQYPRDRTMNNVNLFACVLQVAMWSPYLYYTYFVNDFKKSYFYAVWVGLSRSVLTPNFYFLFVDSIREGFVINVRYCCFKISVSSNNHRYRRETESVPANDHRVQINLVQGAVAGSQRSTFAGREMYEL